MMYRIKLLISEDDLLGGKILLLQLLSLAARRVNDRAVIELAVDEVSSAGD
jgi:hypothetical protein